MWWKFRHLLKKINDNPIPVCLVWSFVLVFLIEALHRHSFVESVLFIVQYPMQYIVNSVFMLALLMLCMVIRRRVFWIYLVSLLWLILGVANSLVLLNRVSPLSWADVSVLTSVTSIFKQYLTTFQIGLAIAFLAICAIVSFFLYWKVPKISRKQHWIRDILAFLICSVGGFVFVVSVGTSMNLFENTGNITLTFQRSGFAYSFANSMVDEGIAKPLIYREKLVKELRDDIDKVDFVRVRETHREPNIIVVQLESFFDLNHMRNYTFSEDPTPNFHKLQEEYTTGCIKVPTVGAGTVNTEFEVLTGMSLKSFGLCEYPYKTILKEQTCESMAYNLQEQGYATAVVHNNRGTFYSRHRVFKQLGFDLFDTVEYMNDLEYNPIGFAKDKVLTGRIIDRMQQTPNKDFIYTITVQTHGKYPSEVVDDTQTITLQGEPDEARRNQFEYYANQMKEVDDFIGELIDAVQALHEDTVIVFFGDHLPTLGITDNELQYQNTYQTSYVIWDNFGLKKKDSNLPAYQLSSVLMAKLGYDNGLLTKFHQKYKGRQGYRTYLNLLQYDMLYGEHYVYDGVDRYEPSDMQIGLNPVTIRNVRQGNGVLVVTGDNFTEASAVYVDGKKKETQVQSSHVLLVWDYEIKEGARVRVRQVTSTGGTLGGSERYIYLGEDVDNTASSGAVTTQESGK